MPSDTGASLGCAPGGGKAAPENVVSRSRAKSARTHQSSLIDNAATGQDSTPMRTRSCCPVGTGLPVPMEL
jgi:hypothetical protein